MIDRRSRSEHYERLEKKARLLYKRWYETINEMIGIIPDNEVELVQKGYVVKFELNKKANLSKHKYALEKILELCQNSQVISSKKDIKKLKTYNWFIMESEKGFKLKPISERDFDKLDFLTFSRFFEKCEGKNKYSKNKTYYKVNSKTAEKYFQRVVYPNYEKAAQFYIYPDIISEHALINNKLFGKRYLYKSVENPKHREGNKYNRQENKIIENYVKKNFEDI